MPAIAQSACGSRKIRPSPLPRLPMAWPAWSYARRNQSPSQPCVSTAAAIASAAARYFAAVASSCSAAASAAYSRAASTNSAAIITDSARPLVRIGAVWKDSSGSVECALRLRQSFQSARPISGSPCAPSRASV